MAATGYTPIILYNSSTTGNTPLAANLAAGEIAINTFDGKIFYKTPSNNVQSLAYALKGANADITSLSGLTTALSVAQGGTGVTTSTGTGSTVLSASPTFTGTLNSTNLAYTGTLTGSTGILNIGSGQLYKDASGSVGIGTTAPNNKLTVGAPNSNGGLNCVASFSGANIVNFNTSGMVVITPTDSIAADIGGSIGFAANGTIMYPTGTIAGRRENATANNYASYMQFSTCNSAGTIVEKMRIDSSGNLLVGTTSGSYKITCNGQPGANGYTVWTNYSDQRLKENITDFKGGLKEVLNLNPKSFNYNELSGYDEDTRARTISGFIAQELELVCPEMVGTTEINGVEYLDTNTSNLSLLLIKAIQELKVIIDTQQEQINSLLGK